MAMSATIQVHHKRFLGMAGGMAILATGSHLASRTISGLIPHLEPKLSFVKSTLWGGIFGAAVQTQSALARHLPIQRKVYILISSSALPSFILKKTGESTSQVMNSFWPLAATLAAYRVYYARKHGINII